MTNLMREHVTEPSRIHYVITRGGEAPNVIPAFAEVFYYVRHPEPEEVKAMFKRLVLAAEGAAMGTETRMEYEVIHGCYNVLPNLELAQRMHVNLVKVGGVDYSETEMQFAQEIFQTLNRPEINLTQAATITPFLDDIPVYPASTDVGDVSWAAPTAGLRTATWVPGTSAHSWQAVACGGTPIGHKGMLVAAKTIALTAVELMLHPEVCEAAKAEMLERQGDNFNYQPMIGDREPPLDYRN